MDTPTLSSRGPKRRKTSPSKSVPPQSNTTPRASFLSPTRASLSRFNPSLLPQATSAGVEITRRTPQNASRTPDLNNAFLATGQDALNFIMGEVGSAMQTVLSAARQQPQNPMIPTVLTGEETDEQMAAIRAANRARKQNERQQEEEERQRRANERRSMAPIEQQRGNSDDGFDAPEMESALPDFDEDEHDLPETPEQLRRQLEIDDAPPRGLLFSSPSKRRKRRINVGEKVLSSPVRRSEQMEAPDSQTTEKQLQSAQLPKIDQVLEIEYQEERFPEKDAETIAKETEKRKLQQELQMLQDEVEQYTRHVEWLNDDDIHGIDDLVQIINSSKPERSHVNQESAPLSSLLKSFLPFSIPIQQPDPSFDKEKPIFSHFPIQKTDPLPLLSLFTPLKVSSTINPPTTPSSPSDAMNQTHHITLSSPASLLTCSLILVVSSTPDEPGNPSVDSLTLDNLSPWASQEIGLHLQKRALEGDTSAIGYALGRYWDMSMKRAQCWSRCSKEFRHLVSISNEPQGTVVDEDEVSTLEPLSFHKTELLPHLGRRFLLFKSSSVILRVGWDLDLDWTGEVESVVSAKAALPQVCRFFLLLRTKFGVSIK
jgi:hypothetical protein